MKLVADHTSHTAFILLGEDARERAVDLTNSVVAFVTAAGTLTTVEVLDTRLWTDGLFDDAAAERVVAWAREQLAARRAG